jgi:hypothetical protein
MRLETPQVGCLVQLWPQWECSAPHNAVWGALLGGCRFYRNAELASHVSQKLVAEPDPDKAAGYLSLLAHVYATAEKWQDVATVRQKMVAMGVKKPADRSWV